MYACRMLRDCSIGPEMYSFLVVLCIAALLLDGVSCHLFSQAIIEKLTHADTLELQQNQEDIESAHQCTLDRLHHAYQGNHTSFVTGCMAAAELDFELDPSATNQSTINAAFHTLCVPECGNAILDAYDSCGLFESSYERKYLAALCGSNENGDLCYELFFDSMDLLTTAAPCFHGTCSCNSLSEGVGRQGCCIDALNDLVNSLQDDLGGFTLDRVYGGCNIAPEAGCNNSPLSDGSSLLRASALALLLPLLVNGVLRCIS